MNSILYVGMDVHTTNYTLCTYSIETDKEFSLTQVKPDHLNILRYINRLKEHHGQDTRIICGYEAGGLGYSLYRALEACDVECVILAPSTMPKAPNERKTDYRDAAKIARCLAYNSYQAVYVPDKQDEAVKEYIRMRDNLKEHIKRLKQQIAALCTRWHKVFNGTKKLWTIAHYKWLQRLQFEDPIAQEAFDEYVIQLNEANARLKRYDEKIEQWATLPRYAQKVSKLSCFCGIKTHVALATIAEVSDFNRFPNANRFASYLGLVPGEYSSGAHINRLGITKQGNSHIRRRESLLLKPGHELVVIHASGSPDNSIAFPVSILLCDSFPDQIGRLRSEASAENHYHKIIFRYAERFPVFGFVSAAEFASDRIT